MLNLIIPSYPNSGGKATQKTVITSFYADASPLQKNQSLPREQPPPKPNQK